ncbi:MAG: DUF4421 family protein [Bacteroidetes bacterium]|nr:DUF4421 family protein [Bacteroidota bacterium]
MYFSRSVVIILLMVLSLAAHAQKAPKTREAKPKKERKKKEKKIPENIEAFNKSFLFKPKFALPGVWFNVSSRLTGKGGNFTWKPAMPGIVGAAIKIKKVYISGAILLPPSDSFKKKYGTTKSRDIYINIQGRVVSWGLYYRDYKGFYLADYKSNYTNWNFDSLGYPKSNNLRVIEGGVNLGFNFNKNFSMAAAFAQSERQKKSAGSFLMSISERYQHIETDSNIVPGSQADFYPNLNRLKQGNFFSTILAFGAGYQIVMGKFHLTPVALIGSGIQVQSYTQHYNQGYRSRLWFNVPTYANARGQLGYNGDNFFANLIYQFEFNSIPIRESRIRLIRNSVELGVGIRF